MNNNIEIFCVTDKHLNFFNDIKYKLAAVGKNNFPSNYITCNTGKNIYYKEEYYSELTFHYWFWKNLLNNYSDETWIGFCQKRRFWLQKKISTKPKNFTDLNKVVLKEVPTEWNKYDAVIQPPMSLKEKKMVMIKRGYRSLIKDPEIFFNEKKHTIKLHFDMHHGYGVLDKAIDVMNSNDREEFREYVNTKTIINPHIMFISKKKIMDQWFNDVFAWLFECEKIFGFDELKGYDQTRLYAYLAERYLSFWFKKHTKSMNWPWMLWEKDE